MTKVLTRNYIPGIWRTLRDKSISIGGINALFDATVNPISLLDRDTVFRAKISTLMAILSWVLAVSAILTPATLSVVHKSFSQDYKTFVKQINITGWNHNQNGNVFATSLFSYQFNNESQIFSFTGASPRTKRLAALVAYGGNIVPIPSPCTSNCSYTIEFDAPALSCQKADIKDILNLSLRPDGVTGGASFSVDIDGLTDPQPVDGNAPWCCVNYNATLEPVDPSSDDGKLGLRNRLRVLSGTYRPGGTPRTMEDIQDVLRTPYFATYIVNITFINGNPIFETKDLKLLTPLDESVNTLTDAAINTGSYETIPARGLV